MGILLSEMKSRHHILLLALQSSFARAASTSNPVSRASGHRQAVGTPLGGQGTSLCLRFVVPEFVTHMGAGLALIGSLPELGSWNVSKAARLVWAPGNQWSVDVPLPEHAAGRVEYKVRMKEHSESISSSSPTRIPVTFIPSGLTPPSR